VRNCEVALKGMGGISFDSCFFVWISIHGLVKLAILIIRAINGFEWYEL
jgi:hypothetical protein